MPEPNNRGEKFILQSVLHILSSTERSLFDTEEKNWLLDRRQFDKLPERRRPFYATTQTIIAADLVIRFLSCITRQNTLKTDRAQ